VIGVILASLVACTGPRTALRPVPERAVDHLCAEATACTDTISVAYMGVDGFVLRRGASAVMTPPLFTHRGLLPTILGFTFRTDTARVDSALRTLHATLGDVSTVLVGHSHYDHLMDMPYIARKYLSPGARIVGSPSMKHILAGDPGAARRAVAIPADDVGTASRAGRWVYAADGKSRVMAIASSHAHNWLFFTIAPGKVRTDYESLPRSAWGWRMGEVYAFLIDFIRADSTPEFRVFFQDAVSKPEFNQLPPLLERDRHAVNLAIVCAGNFEKARDYPSVALENLHPDRVIVGHWDDFFDEWKMDPDVVPMTNTRTLAGRLDAAALGRWMTPLPGAVFRFAFSPAG
jgi:L-ascorbate metabolism protein UlaG (beta-lactamase superfamily)